MPDDKHMTDVKRRLDDHEGRLRELEKFAALIPKIDEKLDRLIEADHGTDLAVMREREQSRDDRIKRLESDLEDLREQADGTAQKLTKWVAYVTAALVALQAMFGDLNISEQVELPAPQEVTATDD